MAFASGFAANIQAANPPPSPIDFWDPNGGAVDRAGNPILYGEGPTFSDNPWDLIFLNGDPCPGICSVKAEPTIHFDKKKPGGVDGLTITTQGYIPGPVQVQIMLWTAEQWEFFQAIANKIWIKPKRGGQVKAIDISHPATDLWQIKSIVVEGVSVPEDGPVPQSKIVRIKAVEFLPPEKTRTATVKQAGKVAVDKHVDRAKNAQGTKSPGESETGPTGAKKDTTPGSK
jgi:hypothetical protein